MTVGNRSTVLPSFSAPAIPAKRLKFGRGYHCYYTSLQFVGTDQGRQLRLKIGDFGLAERMLDGGGESSPSCCGYASPWPCLDYGQTDMAWSFSGHCGSCAAPPLAVGCA